MNGAEYLKSLIAKKVADMQGIDDSLSDNKEDMATTKDGIPWHLNKVKIIRVSSGWVDSMGVPDSTSLKRLAF